jgi:hypothetical protein
MDKVMWALRRCTLSPGYSLTALLSDKAKQQLSKTWDPYKHKFKPGKLYMWEESTKKSKAKGMKELPKKLAEEILGFRWVVLGSFAEYLEPLGTQ